MADYSYAFTVNSRPLTTFKYANRLDFSPSTVSFSVEADAGLIASVQAGQVIWPVVVVNLGGGDTLGPLYIDDGASAQVYSESDGVIHFQYKDARIFLDNNVCRLHGRWSLRAAVTEAFRIANVMYPTNLNLLPREPIQEFHIEAQKLSSALAEIIRDHGFTLGCTNSGAFYIAQFGTGTLPTSATWVSTAEQARVPSYDQWLIFADSFVHNHIIQTPIQYLSDRCMPQWYPGYQYLMPVGKDTDGKWKYLPDLSYAPRTLVPGYGTDDGFNGMMQTTVFEVFTAFYNCAATLLGNGTWTWEDYVERVDLFSSTVWKCFQVMGCDAISAPKAPRAERGEMVVWAEEDEKHSVGRPPKKATDDDSTRGYKLFKFSGDMFRPMSFYGNDWLDDGDDAVIKKADWTFDDKSRVITCKGLMYMCDLGFYLAEDNYAYSPVYPFDSSLQIVDQVYNGIKSKHVSAKIRLHMDDRTIPSERDADWDWNRKRPSGFCWLYDARGWYGIVDWMTDVLQASILSEDFYTLSGEVPYLKDFPPNGLVHETTIALRGKSVTTTFSGDGSRGITAPSYKAIEARRQFQGVLRRIRMIAQGE